MRPSKNNYCTCWCPPPLQGTRHPLERSAAAIYTTTETSGRPTQRFIILVFGQALVVRDSSGSRGCPQHLRWDPERSQVASRGIPWDPVRHNLGCRGQQRDPMGPREVPGCFPWHPMESHGIPQDTTWYIEGSGMIPRKHASIRGNLNSNRRNPSWEPTGCGRMA